MRMTAVKDVSSSLMNQMVSATGKTVTGNGAFQKVWSNQMSMGTADTAAGNANLQKQSQADLQAGKSSSADTAVQDAQKQLENTQAADTRETASEETKPQDGMTEEQNEISEGQDVTESGLTEEQLRAMEVLGTATMRLMEQIADVFGVSLEEVQAAMDGMGMSQADLLDASKLGSLLLELGGAQDAYALLTDSALYENYQAVMAQLQQVLQESADTLGTAPEQLAGLLKDSLDSMQAVQEENLAEVPSDRFLNSSDEQSEPTGENALQNPGMTTDAVQEGQAAPKQDAGTQEKGGRQTEGGAEKGDHPNLLIENLRTDQFQPQMQQTQEVSQSSVWNADTRQIMEQILDYMKLSLNGDATSLEMQLHPASLGTLQIQIASKGGVVTAHFIAQNEAVKTALESQMVQLRDQFEEQGVKVEAIEVTVQTHEFEQNLEQGRGRSQQETERKGRSRRIAVSGRFAAEDAEAEETVEADRTLVGGSTVSYSA